MSSWLVFKMQIIFYVWIIKVRDCPFMMHKMHVYKSLWHLLNCRVFYEKIWGHSNSELWTVRLIFENFRFENRIFSFLKGVSKIFLLCYKSNTTLNRVWTRDPVTVLVTAFTKNARKRPHTCTAPRQPTIHLVWNEQLKRLHIYFTCKTFNVIYFLWIFL